MSKALRDFYLCALFLLCAGAFFAPYFGFGLPDFPYQTSGGKVVKMSVSVALYGLFLVVTIAAFAKRLMAKPESTEETDAA